MQGSLQGSYLVCGVMSSSRQKRPDGRRLCLGTCWRFGGFSIGIIRTKPAPNPGQQSLAPDTSPRQERLGNSQNGQLMPVDIKIGALDRWHANTMLCTLAKLVHMPVYTRVMVHVPREFQDRGCAQTAQPGGRRQQLAHLADQHRRLLDVLGLCVGWRGWGWGWDGTTGSILAGSSHPDLR